MTVDILGRLFYTSFYDEWAGNFLSCNFDICKLPTDLYSRFLNRMPLHMVRINIRDQTGNGEF